MTKVIIWIGSILVILILLFFIITFLGNWIFNKKVENEIEMFFNGAMSNKSQTIKESDLNNLPNKVQKWLKYSQVVGKEKLQTVRLKQNVTLRTKPNQSWMPTEAEYYYTIDKPGLLWKTKINVAPFIHLVGRDLYYEGQGSMIIKFLSLITVADAKGDYRIDQGSLLRYLAESVFFPTFALSEYITWEALDNNSVKATMTYEGISGTGIFTFNDLGEVISFEADRYMESDGEFTIQKWYVPVWDYQEFEGFRIPTKGKVIWKLDEGDFEWYRFKLIDIDYNIPQAY